jgi:hypothetical protein
MKRQESLLLDNPTLSQCNSWYRSIKTRDDGSVTFSDIWAACNGSITNRGNYSYDKVMLVMPYNIYKDVEAVKVLAKRWTNFIKLFAPSVEFYDFNETPFNTVFKVNLEFGAALSTADFNQSGQYSPLIRGGFDPKNVFSLQNHMGIVCPAESNGARRVAYILARYLQRDSYTPIPASVLELYDGGVDPVTALYLGHYGIKCWLDTWPENHEELLANWKKIRESGGYITSQMQTNHYKSLWGDYTKSYNNYYGIVYPHVFDVELLKSKTPADMIEKATTTKAINDVFATNLRVTFRGHCGSEDDFESRFFFGSSPTSFQPSIGVTWKEEFFKTIIDPCKKIEAAWEKMSPLEFVDYVNAINKSVYGKLPAKEAEAFDNSRG